MKKYVYLLILGGFVCGLFASCQDEKEKYIPTPPVVSIENLSELDAVPQDDSIVLKANVESPLETTLNWFVNGEETSTDSVYVFKANELGQFEVKLTATNADGEVSAVLPVEVYGKYKYGTFVLNEGRQLRGIPGTLVFINPKGEITDSVYYKENGASLGITTQDLFIKNNKLYLISQRGGEDGGFLTILNAETLKKERSYQDEFSAIQPTTHIAVLGDDDIYVRSEGKGIYRFTPSTGTLTFIENTKGANKTTMAVADGKVFVVNGSKLQVIEAGQTAVSKEITATGAIPSVIPSADGNIWFCCSATKEEPAKIMKLNAKDYTVQENAIEDETATTILRGGFFASPYITAKGDTLYMGNMSKPMPVCRHIFSQKKTDLLGNIMEGLENVMTMYNSIAVHPITGEIYANLINSYGRDPENKICVFGVDNDQLTFKKSYHDYTVNPAGIFFTYNFK